jgi:acyl carrier protein
VTVLEDTVGSEHAVVRESVRSFFKTRLNVVPPNDQHDLLASGLLDSLGIVELVLFAEREHAAVLDLQVLDFESLRSIEAIAELISSSRLAQERAE